MSYFTVNTELPRTKIRLVFPYPDPQKPNWPHIGYNFEERIAQLQTTLQKKCPDLDFYPTHLTATDEEAVAKLLAKDEEIDSYLIYFVGCLWGDYPERIVKLGKPVLMVDDLFAGTGIFLHSYAKAMNLGAKVIGVASSDFTDVVQAVQCLDCCQKLRRSTVLVVGEDFTILPDKRKDYQKTREICQSAYGTTVKALDFEAINTVWHKINKADAQAVAASWVKGAEKVLEPKQEDIESSATMYLAMRELLEQNNAQAISISCMEGIYGGQMVRAYPCLGFMQLDNSGLVGGCEADLRCAMTKLLMRYLVHRPGFISDPVIDTAKNEIIYAHCVAPTKVFGDNCEACPYHLRTHAEDHQGACNRSILPLNEIVTTLKFDHHKKQVIFHQGITVANIDEEKACRTKLAAKVKGDCFKLLNYWYEWGWHRVTYFGDFKQSVYNIASLLDFEVIEEA